MPTASRLREVRLRERWGLQQIGRRAGVSKQTVWRAERGGSVQLEALLKLSSALGVPLRDISPEAADEIAALAKAVEPAATGA